jgi:hypothetical protein
MSANPATNKGSRRDCLYTWKAGHPLTAEEYHAQFIARFWAKVDKTPGQGPNGDCWEWQGSRATRVYNGKRYDYGQIAYRYKPGVKRPMRAHVASYFIHTGELLQGFDHPVCHTCDNPPCVRPEHLWKGTPQENYKDAQAKGRAPVAAPETRPRTLRARLTVRQLVLIHAARKAKDFSIYDMGEIVGWDFTRYHRFEAGDEPTCYAEQLRLILSALELPEEKLRLRESQWRETFAASWRTKQARLPRALVNPKHPFQERRPHKFWSKLPAPILNHYRADTLRAVLMEKGEQITVTVKNADISYSIFMKMMRGEDVRAKHVMKLADYCGLKREQIYEMAKAA